MRLDQTRIYLAPASNSALFASYDSNPASPSGQPGQCLRMEHCFLWHTWQQEFCLGLLRGQSLLEPGLHLHHPEEIGGALLDTVTLNVQCSVMFSLQCHECHLQ